MCARVCVCVGVRLPIEMIVLTRDLSIIAVMLYS